MSNNPLQIGITGGIGSGKSLVCKIFSTLGAPVYDADSRAKHLINTDQSIKASIIREFGEKAYKNDALDRDHIASVVFNNSEKLNTLNGIVHPAVGINYNNWVKSQSHSYVIKEAALMFESGSYKVLDKIVNVSAPKDVRIARVLKRDAFRTKSEVNKIIDKQWSDVDRSSRSDYTILNDESELLIPQILKLDKLFIGALNS